MSTGQEPSLDEVLAGLVVSLRAELAQTPRNSSLLPSSEGSATLAAAATR